MEANTMTQDAMQKLVDNGTAQPLLSDGVPGPVRVDGQWWVVTQGLETYEPVQDPAAIAQFDTDLQRMMQAWAAVRAAASKTR